MLLPCIAIETIKKLQQDRHSFRMKSDKQCFFRCQNPPTARYFPFPTSEKIRILWNKFCDLTPNIRNIDKKICERHFLPSDFTIINEKKLLRFDAVPSVKKWNHMQWDDEAVDSSGSFVVSSRTPQQYKSKQGKNVSFYESDRKLVNGFDPDELTAKLFDAEAAEELLEFTIDSKLEGPEFVKIMGDDAYSLINAELQDTRQNITLIDKKHSELKQAINMLQGHIENLSQEL